MLAYSFTGSICLHHRRKHCGTHDTLILLSGMSYAYHSLIRKIQGTVVGFSVKDIPVWECPHVTLSYWVTVWLVRMFLRKLIYLKIHKCFNCFPENVASGKANLTEIFFFCELLELLCLVPQDFNAVLIVYFINSLRFRTNYFSSLFKIYFWNHIIINIF